MTAYAYSSHQPSAPPMYPSEVERAVPVPPVRSEFMRHTQEEALLPEIPKRIDKPHTSHDHSSTTRRLAGHTADETYRRGKTEKTPEEIDSDSACNYNRYATKKTIGHALLTVALITSNAMQLRMLILQKQRDHIWIASLVLVCVSILLQFGVGFLLFLQTKEDIRNPHKQTKLERLNNFTLAATILVTIINVVLNIFMLTINPKAFLDTNTLEYLQQRQPS